MIKSLLFTAAFAAVSITAGAQNLKGRYVSKAEADGTIYHTMPCTLFERAGAGDLTFDITYKEHSDGRAAVNFTYVMPQITPADSVRFSAGPAVITAPAAKLYIEPEGKSWKHRFSFRAELDALGVFFNEQAVPEVTVYAGGKSYAFRVKRSAWKSYAPVGYKIIEVIRINEK